MRWKKGIHCFPRIPMFENLTQKDFCAIYATNGWAFRPMTIFKLCRNGCNIVQPASEMLPRRRLSCTCTWIFFSQRRVLKNRLFQKSRTDRPSRGWSPIWCGVCKPFCVANTHWNFHVSRLKRFSQCTSSFPTYKCPSSSGFSSIVSCSHTVQLRSSSRISKAQCRTTSCKPPGGSLHRRGGT